MKKRQLNKDKKPVNTKLTETGLKRWHQFALDNYLTKEAALEELIKRGSKVKLLARDI